MGPCWPCAPCGPAGPTGPEGPVSPAGPEGPCGPVQADNASITIAAGMVTNCRITLVRLAPIGSKPPASIAERKQHEKVAFAIPAGDLAFGYPAKDQREGWRQMSPAKEHARSKQTQSAGSRSTTCVASRRTRRAAGSLATSLFRPSRRSSSARHPLKERYKEYGVVQRRSARL